MISDVQAIQLRMEALQSAIKYGADPGDGSGVLSRAKAYLNFLMGEQDTPAETTNAPDGLT